MAVFRPFKGIRPSPSRAAAVSALPYDVMNREEAVSMAAGNPLCFLRVSRSEIDLPACSAYEDAVYEKAKENLASFLADGTLFEEEKPVYYIYRQMMWGRVQTGLVGCAAIDDYENGVIKRHEFTRKEKEKDRICHFDVCDCNTEPIFLTYRKNEKLNRLIQNWIKFHRPEYDFQSADGFTHLLWPVDDDAAIAEIQRLFAATASLYIADGHHRAASAAAVGKKRREENPGYSGEEEFNFVLSVAFPDEDLFIMDYNRVVEDLNGLPVAAFLEQVAEKFSIEKKESRFRPMEKHVFGMYLNGDWYALTAKPGTYPEEDPVNRLDAAILQNHLLSPILGIEDPRTDSRIDFIGGIRGLEELERRAGSGVAFALCPVLIEDLLSVADSGKVMPPKSTWFEPKLRSGLFLHRLGD